MNNYRAAGALALLSLSLPLRALDLSDAPLKPYIGESLTYQFSESSRQSDNGVGATLSGGVPLNKWFNVEVGGFYTNFNPDSDTPSYKWKDYGARVDGQFFYSRNPAFSPYFDVGVGYDHSELKTVDQSSSSALTDVGLGAIHYFSLFHTPLGVRADARYRWTFVDDSKFSGLGVSAPFGEPILSLGLVIPLGSSAKPAAVPPPVAPETPKPEPVVSHDTPNHKFDDIHFAFDKSDLTEYSKALLDQDAATIAKLAAKYPDLKVDVAGHTDWIGTDAYNQALSERRANSAKDYLIKKGVDAVRIRTFAFGESKPIATNKTPEGRALNRRDEISTTNEK